MNMKHAGCSEVVFETAQTGFVKEQQGLSKLPSSRLPLFLHR